MRVNARAFLIATLSLTIFAQGMWAQSLQQKAINRPASLDTRIAEFEKALDQIRQELKIPAMSAAIVKDQKVVWARGLGYADMENKIPATEHTAYHLASLTKTYASTIMMKLIEDGKVKLDDPVSKYGITLESEGVIRVKHIFSHTSEGNPGERYRYNGNRFAELDKIIQKVTGKPFAELLIANILEPLGMNETAPNTPSVLKLKPAGATPSKEEEEVKAAVTEIMAGYNAGNVEQIERYMSRGQTGFNSDGQGYLTQFADINEIREQYKAGVRINLQANNLEAASYGDTAIATCITAGKVTFPGGGRDLGPWRTSYVFNKQNGGWKLVHAHMSKIEGAPIVDKQEARFKAVSKILSQPYQLDRSSNIVKGKYPTNFSSSAGLITTVLDMAKYDIAIDQNRFLKKETQQLAFTPMVSTKGQSLPYGLGWFTQNYKGMKFIWHYGYWTCNSSLILKVPERNITFIVMANTDNLSRPTDLGSGDVTSSPVGLAFLKTFIFPEMLGGVLPEVDWNAPADQLKEQLKATAGKPYSDLYIKELLVKSRVYGSVGQASDSSRLFRVYADLFSKGLPDDLAKKTALAEIARVEDNQEKQVEFSLPGEQTLRVFAIGEGTGGEMFDYGWIENIDSGKTVWVMKESETVAAGGAEKNRKIDAVVTLPAGRYRVKYKTDDSHSFDNWNSLPPEINFWGIAVYSK